MDKDDKTWFTLQNLSELTQKSDSEIQGIIKHSDLFVRSSIPDDAGETLFSTKYDYQQKGSILNRFIGAFKNRID